MDPYVLIEYEKKNNTEFNNNLLHRIRDQKVIIDNYLKDHKSEIGGIHREFIELLNMEKELSNYYKITKTIIPNLSLSAQEFQKFKLCFNDIYINGNKSPSVLSSKSMEEEIVDDSVKSSPLVSNSDSLLSSEPEGSNRQEGDVSPVSPSDSLLSSKPEGSIGQEKAISPVSASDSLLSSDNSLMGGSSTLDSLLSSNNSGIDNQSILEMSSPRSDDNTMDSHKIMENYYGRFYMYKFGIIDTSFMKVNISNDIHIMGDETIRCLNNKLLYLYNLEKGDIYDENNIYLWCGYNYTLMLDRFIYDIYIQLEEYLDTDKFTFENILKYFEYLGITINLFNNDYYSLFIKDFKDKIINFDNFRNHIFVQNTIKDYYFYNCLNFSYVDNDKHYFINPYKSDNDINNITFLYKNLNDKVISDFGEIVLNEIYFYIGDGVINQKYFPNYKGDAIDKEKIKENIDKLNSIYYRNEEILYFEEREQLFNYETYINNLYWKYNINVNTDITSIFNNARLNNQLPFIVLNDPISNKIINKVYIPVFNKYDDKYEPLINKESMIKLFNNNFDIPIDNVFKKKTKNGLYMCFYIDNYIESLSYTSQGTIIKNGDTVDIESGNKIISNISKSSDIYKNINIGDNVVDNIGDVVRYRPYNNLFTYLYLDKSGKSFIYMSLNKNSYYNLDNIGNIFNQINNYCNYNIESLKYIYEKDHINNFYRSSSNNNIKLGVKFLFTHDKQYYYDLASLNSNILSLNSYFDIVPKFFKIGTIVDYLLYFNDIPIQKSGKIVKINFVGNDILYDIKYDMENDERDIGVHSSFVNSQSSDLYIDLYYKRQTKYNFKDYINIEYLSEFLDENEIILFIKQKFGIKNTKEALEMVNYLNQNKKVSDPITIRIYLIGNYIKSDKYEFIVNVNGVTNIKMVRMIKVLLDRLCNLKKIIGELGTCLTGDKILIGEKMTHTIDDDILSDDESDDLMSDDDENMFDFERGKLNTFKKKIAEEELQILDQNNDIDYTESDIFTFTSEIPKLTNNYCRYMLIKTDYQLFNYKALNHSNSSYAKRTSGNPIGMTDSEKIAIDKMDMEVYPKIEEIIMGLDNVKELNKKLFINNLKKNFHSYGYTGYSEYKRDEYTIDFDEKQKLINLKNKIPIALKCKSKIRKDVWYTCPRIYCTSCNKPINLWYFVLPSFNNSENITSISDYNPGIHNSNTECSFFMPSLKGNFGNDDWKTCHNCGLDISKHELFCPYNPSHKCNFKSLNDISLEDMERYKKDSVEKLLVVNKFINESNANIEKIKRNNPLGYLKIQLVNSNPPEYYLPLSKIRREHIYFDNKAAVPLYSDTNFIVANKYYIRYNEEKMNLEGYIKNVIYSKRYCNRSCIVDLIPGKKETSQKCISILTNQFGWSELLRPCIVKKFHENWYMKNDNINKYLKLTYGELYKEERENYNYICKDFGKTLANGQISNLPELLYNYLNVDKLNNPLKIQTGLYNKREKYYIRVGNEHNNNSFLHCLYRIFNLELYKSKINNFEEFRCDIVDKCSYKIFNNMDLSLLNIIFRENYDIEIDAYQNFIEYIYSDEFKNHQYLLDYFTNYYHFGGNLYNIIILSIVDDKLVVNCPKTFTYNSKNMSCLILKINNHYEPIGYFYNNMLNYIIQKDDLNKNIYNEIKEKCNITGLNDSNIYLSYDKIKKSKFNILEYYHNNEGYIDKLLINESSSSKNVIVCIKPQIILNIKAKVYDGTPYKKSNIENIYNYFNVYPVYNYYKKQQGDKYNGLYINYNLINIEDGLELDETGNKYKFNGEYISSINISNLKFNNRHELFPLLLDELSVYLYRKKIEYKIVIEGDIDETVDINTLLLMNREKVNIRGIIVNNLYLNVKKREIDDNIFMKINTENIEVVVYDDNLTKFSDIDEFINNYSRLFYYLDKNFNIQIYRFRINRHREIEGIYLEDGSFYEYLYRIEFDFNLYKKIFMIEPQYKTSNEMSVYKDNSKIIGDKLKAERYFIVLRELSLYLHKNSNILENVSNIVNSLIYTFEHKKSKLQKILYTILKEITNITPELVLNEKNNILCSGLDSINCIQAKHCKYTKGESYLSNFIKMNIEKLSMEDILIQWMNMTQEEKSNFKNIIKNNDIYECKICIDDFNKTFNRILDDMVRNRYIISMVLKNKFNHIFQSEVYQKKSNLELIFTNENVDDIIFKFSNLVYNYINQYINFNIYNEDFTNEKKEIRPNKVIDENLVFNKIEGIEVKNTGIFRILKNKGSGINKSKILYNNFDKKFNQDTNIYKELIKINTKKNIIKKNKEMLNIKDFSEIKEIGKGMIIVDIDMKPKFIIK